MAKILIIEDNLEVRENLAEILELSGYEVEQAADGKEGVNLAKNSNPDLILCDIMLPVLDGFGILQIVSRDSKLKNIPFIFLTAKTELVDMRKGMNLGADDYITKPFQKDELLSVVEMRLKKAGDLISGNLSESRLKNLQRANSLLTGFFEDAPEREYPALFDLYSENDRPRNVFLIKEGIAKETLVTDFGREIILRLSTRGQMPGIWEAYQESSYSTNCTTITNCRVSILPSDDFSECIQKEPFAGLAIREIVHRQKTALERKLLAMAHFSVRKKVSLMLEELVNHELASRENPLEINRADLGALCGTAKETVTRTLSDFKEEGLIEVNGGKVIVLDIEGLAAMPE